MKIRIVKACNDEKGFGIPPNMLGKTYQVLKEGEFGYWVKDGKLEVLALYEEVEIVQL